MRISDWSSDVCSSDLHGIVARGEHRDASLGALAHSFGDEHHRMAEDILDAAHHEAERLGRVLRPLRPPEMREKQDDRALVRQLADRRRSEEHTSELQSLMRISYAVFCLKKKKKKNRNAPETEEK